MDISELFFFPVRFLITHPERIAAIATIFVVAFIILWRIKNHKSWSLLTNAILWTAFALWEWLILVNTPEANIRFDLLIIYPVLFVSTIWGIIAVFRNN